MNRPYASMIYEDQTSTTSASYDATNRLNASFVGDGTVSNTELGYLSGVTSDVQQQMDNKVNTLQTQIDDKVEVADPLGLGYTANASIVRNAANTEWTQAIKYGVEELGSGGSGLQVVGTADVNLAANSRINGSDFIALNGSSNSGNSNKMIVTNGNGTLSWVRAGQTAPGLSNTGASLGMPPINESSFSNVLHLNGSNNTTTLSHSSATYIQPVRNITDTTGFSDVKYHPSTKELVYSSDGGGELRKGSNNGFYAVSSGSSSVGAAGVVIGNQAGPGGVQGVAIGMQAGRGGANSVAIGHEAGRGSQGDETVLIGRAVGRNGSGAGAVAIGSGASYGGCGVNSISIGHDAAASATGAIAIGHNATNSTADSCVVKTLRSVAHGIGVGVVHYNSTTNELSVSNDAPSGGGGLTGSVLIARQHGGANFTTSASNGGTTFMTGFSEGQSNDIIPSTGPSSGASVFVAGSSQTAFMEFCAPSTGIYDIACLINLGGFGGSFTSFNRVIAVIEYAMYSNGAWTWLAQPYDTTTSTAGRLSSVDKRDMSSRTFTTSLRYVGSLTANTKVRVRLYHEGSTLGGTRLQQMNTGGNTFIVKSLF